MFTWKQAAQAGPIVASAPMDGYSDSAFRQVVKYVCPSVITFTEFVSADGFCAAPKKMKPLVAYEERERPIIVQLFGKHPETFAKAAQILEEMGFDGIDINFGCPAKKVVGSGHGSDLIRNPCLAADIVAATQGATKLDVSIKTRLGWHNDETLQDFIGGVLKAGAKAVTIHGRTVAQQYSGTANWEPIYALKKRFSEAIILGNGDITSGEDAVEKIQNLNGVMIGRGSFGNPFVFRDVYEALHEKSSPLLRGARGVLCETKNKIPTWKDVILFHAEALIRTKGEKRAMLEFRKHLLSYSKGFRGAKELRRDMTSIESMEDIRRVVEVILEGKEG